MIKMIALDLDNTLLTSEKTISKANETVLKELHNKGVKVVLCTGRPINAIWPLIEQLDLLQDEDFTITFNGALVVHNRDKAELAKSGVDKAHWQALHEFAQKIGAPLDILDFEQVYSITDLKHSLYEDQFHGQLKFDHLPFADLDDQKLYSKAVICDRPELLDEYETKFTPELKQSYHIVRSQPHIMEFLAPDMDKVVGLGKLLEHFGWNFSNLMTFGDASNDLGMIEHAKVGVAMANASDEVKNVSDAITLSNDDDGVAAFLKRKDTQALFK